MLAYFESWRAKGVLNLVDNMGVRKLMNGRRPFDPIAINPSIRFKGVPTRSRQHVQNVADKTGEIRTTCVNGVINEKLARKNGVLNLCNICLGNERPGGRNLHALTICVCTSQ